MLLPLSFFFAALAPAALGQVTSSVHILDYLDGECPPECPAAGTTVELADLARCRQTLATPGWQACSFTGVVTFSGSEAVTPCESASESLGAYSVALDAINLPSFTGLFENGTGVQLRFGTKPTQACKWWNALVEDDQPSSTCKINVTAVNMEDVPVAESSVGATSLTIPLDALARYDVIGLVSDGTAGCGSFDTVDYTGLQWDFVAAGVSTSGAWQQLCLSFLGLSLVYFFVPH